MTVEEFWQNIATTAQPDPYRHSERLVARLRLLPTDEILDFDYWWVQARNEAYCARLWVAAELIAGAWVSDDRFEYFIGRLILRGRETFTRAVADPDSLAQIVDGDHEPSFEGYPAHNAWMKATGSTHEDGGWERLIAAAEARHGEYFGLPDLDEPLWNDDTDQVRQRLPLLAARFLDNPPRSS